MSFFSKTEQDGKTGPVLGVLISVRWRGYKGTVKEANMVKISCIYVCKWKMGPVETIPGIGENDGGGEFNYDIL
jgi:hypothetical protein